MSLTKLKMFHTQPDEYREQLIGADRRVIDRTLFTKDGLPRCIYIRCRATAGPTMLFRFNTVGWPRKHQASYETERRVSSVANAREVYQGVLTEMHKIDLLCSEGYLSLMSGWQNFITAYDHYFVEA